MKPWWKSKTLWLNFVATTVAGLTAFVPQLQSLMTPQNFALFSLGVGMVNVMLRFITSQALGASSGPTQ